jgi:hypothetical protein
VGEKTKFDIFEKKIIHKKMNHRSLDHHLPTCRRCVTLGAATTILGALAVVLTISAIAMPPILSSVIRTQALAASPPLPRTLNGNAIQFPMANGKYHHYAYLFNITNPRAILERGAKPNLVEVGPFVYRRVKRRENVSWDLGADTMTFAEWEPFWFDREATLKASNGRYDDDTAVMITTLDFVFLGSLPQIGPLLFKTWYEARRLTSGGDETQVCICFVRSFV